MLEGGLSASKGLKTLDGRVPTWALLQFWCRAFSDVYQAMSSLWELSLKFNGTFRQEWAPYVFLLFGLQQYHQFLSTRVACLEVVFEFECRATFFDFFEGQAHFSSLWYAKICLTLNEPVWDVFCSFFVQTSTLAPSMHWKLTEHGKGCTQNYQPPLKSLFELKDDSIIIKLIAWNIYNRTNLTLFWQLETV